MNILYKFTLLIQNRAKTFVFQVFSEILLNAKKFEIGGPACPLFLAVSILTFKNVIVLSSWRCSAWSVPFRLR